MDGAPIFSGGEYNFVCATSGLSMAAVKWLINDTEMTDGSMNQTIFTNKGSIAITNYLYRYFYTLIRTEVSHWPLQFTAIDLRHAGNLTCEASNRFSSRRCTYSLTVLCKFSLFCFFKLIIIFFVCLFSLVTYVIIP